ncbi:MAG TPA: chorismate synthase, partial [Nitrospiraceae bacterium]|nr:chorismate synthase [Nitrospiraceae bacterium]
MLRYLNAGESHGRGLMAVVEGVPSGLPVTAEEINADLIRRQGGYGRGGRMRIEKDRIEFICGVRKGKTLGNPLGLLIWNKDWENWKDIMASEPGPPSTERVVTRPRPGHADLVGAIKYGHRDIRNVLEKASARETAIRVAIGGVAKSLLAQFGMRVVSYTMDIGGVAAPSPNDPLSAYEHAEQSDVRCHDPETAKKMIEQIRAAKHKGDSLGGIFEVVVTNVPIGLGTFAQWDRRLSARLAFAAMSIQA